MPRPRIFIGSSNERRDVARAVEANLQEVADTCFWPHIFRPGHTTYQNLIDTSNAVDFAVIILGPDDETTSRGTTQPSPRDNLVLELGLFVGALGPDRVFAIVERGTSFKVMSDYHGVNWLDFDPARNHELKMAVSSASTDIIHEISRLGPVGRSSPKDLLVSAADLDGLERTYTSFEDAEGDLYNDLANTIGPLQIFCYIGSKDLGIRGALFELMKSLVEAGGVDIRVLHASARSPVFDSQRLLALGKDPERVRELLDHTRESLHRLEQRTNSTLRRRSHDLPYIWRLYCLPDRLYFMPYTVRKDATKHSPVLVFSRTSGSMYYSFRDWFDHVWSSSSPVRVTLSDLISPATPAGAALFLKWDGMHVFGVPRRDISASHNRLRFFGIGGKREHEDETLEACALREAREELAGAIDVLKDADTTTYVRRDGTTREIYIAEQGVIPRLVLERANYAGAELRSSTSEDYVLVGFDAELNAEPRPHRELAAILLMNDACLNHFLHEPTLELSRLEALGGKAIFQNDISIPGTAKLVPHGTAAFLIRSLPNQAS
ncbi:nucleotide-binding protein [Sphingomonas sp. LB-2]|uniref:TIR domain-containing protein n=1 Tax=Sphingomonas caeni TaxID=2984949 RepID=UPI00222FCAC9|nr:TIR domain-containing protein [Sphingomonas caeni]MCW3847734.1 nucleotide-binding protein [Sphingomonas caeni]